MLRWADAGNYVSVARLPSGSLATQSGCAGEAAPVLPLLRARMIAALSQAPDRGSASRVVRRSKKPKRADACHYVPRASLRSPQRRRARADPNLSGVARLPRATLRVARQQPTGAP